MISACHLAPMTVPGNRCMRCGHRTVQYGSPGQVRQTRYMPSLWLTEHYHRWQARRTGKRVWAR